MIQTTWRCPTTIRWQSRLHGPTRSLCQRPESATGASCVRAISSRVPLSISKQRLPDQVKPRTLAAYAPLMSMATALSRAPLSLKRRQNSRRASPPRPSPTQMIRALSMSMTNVIYFRVRAFSEGRHSRAGVKPALAGLGRRRAGRKFHSVRRILWRGGRQRVNDHRCLLTLKLAETAAPSGWLPLTGCSNC